MVFIFLYARLQSRSLLPVTIARDNTIAAEINSELILKKQFQKEVSEIIMKATFSEKGF